MSKQELDELLERRWSKIRDGIEGNLASWRSATSLEVLVERTAVAQGVPAVEGRLGSPPKPADHPAGGRVWGPPLLPVRRYRTPTISLQADDLRGEGGSYSTNIETAVEALVSTAISIEHYEILHPERGGAGGGGVLATAKRNPANEDHYRKSDPGGGAGGGGRPVPAHRPELWMQLRGENYRSDLPGGSDTMAQHLRSPYLYDGDKGFDLRFTAHKPVAIHEVTSWRIIRLANAAASIQLCLESAWAIEHLHTRAHLEVHERP